LDQVIDIKLLGTRRGTGGEGRGEREVRRGRWEVRG
jgi:hypothetical protein